MNHLQSVKEVLRHIAFTVGAADFLDGRRQRKGYKIEHLVAPTAAERFRAIYEIGTWLHNDGQKSSSGVGSEQASTESVRTSLGKITAELNCQTVLDIGCGDWNWMQNVALPGAYIGIDIVPEVIEANQQYVRQGVSFEVVDAIAGPLRTADIAFCREVLFHLSFGDGLAVFENIRRSAKWLIATTDQLWFNSDIRTGDFA